MARPASLQKLIDELSAIHEPNLSLCPDYVECEGRADYVKRVAGAMADWAAAEATEARRHGVHIIVREAREQAFDGLTSELIAAYSDLGDTADERAAAIGMRVAAE